MSSLGSRVSIELPAVDDHIVVPDSGYEIDDGQVVPVAPSLEPHATRHSKLSALLEAHKAAAFDVASDMLTRTSAHTERAPDACVYPRARDPRTGGRQLEHLAFDVASTESLGSAGKRAAALAGRGVRRVFAIDVTTMRVLEWMHAHRRWTVLDAGASIEDPALATPLPVRALLRDAEADYAVGRALVLKRNPAVEEARQESKTEGRAEGRTEGLAEAVLAVLASRGLDVSAEAQARIRGERDPARLGRWLGHVAACESAAELLAML